MCEPPKKKTKSVAAPSDLVQHLRLCFETPDKSLARLFCKRIDGEPTRSALLLSQWSHLMASKSDESNIGSDDSFAFLLEILRSLLMAFSSTIQNTAAEENAVKLFSKMFFNELKIRDAFADAIEIEAKSPLPRFELLSRIIQLVLLYGAKQPLIAAKFCARIANSIAKYDTVITHLPRDVMLIFSEIITLNSKDPLKTLSLIAESVSGTANKTVLYLLSRYLALFLSNMYKNFLNLSYIHE
eukprot:TRINITY_DN7609_c0_g1_i1.p2 TRINITY_DN7609_c0_g1~~TRINITY_DN7609_c0_g1_i1.p2  ORF type:complete len:242 (+),score=47.50 TRINITY_DN7609_c0_g1_i1:69-794(+)